MIVHIKTEEEVRCIAKKLNFKVLQSGKYIYARFKFDKRIVSIQSHGLGRVIDVMTTTYSIKNTYSADDIIAEYVRWKLNDKIQNIF